MRFSRISLDFMGLKQEKMGVHGAINSMIARKTCQFYGNFGDLDGCSWESWRWLGNGSFTINKYPLVNKKLLKMIIEIVDLPIFIAW